MLLYYFSYMEYQDIQNVTCFSGALSEISRSVVTTVQKTGCDSTLRVTLVSSLLSIAAKTVSLKSRGQEKPLAQQ